METWCSANGTRGMNGLSIKLEFNERAIKGWPTLINCGFMSAAWVEMFGWLPWRCSHVNERTVDSEVRHWWRRGSLSRSINFHSVYCVARGIGVTSKAVAADKNNCESHLQKQNNWLRLQIKHVDNRDKLETTLAGRSWHHSMIGRIIEITIGHCRYA